MGRGPFFRAIGSLVNNLEIHASGMRKRKYTRLRTIREFSQPNPSAIFSHAHSMALAAAGIMRDAAPIASAIFSSRGLEKIHARASNPVTMTSRVLNLSFRLHDRQRLK